MISDDLAACENASLQNARCQIQAKLQERATESISCFVEFSIRFIDKIDLV